MTERYVLPAEPGFVFLQYLRGSGPDSRNDVLTFDLEEDFIRLPIIGWLIENIEENLRSMLDLGPSDCGRLEAVHLRPAERRIHPARGNATAAGAVKGGDIRELRRFVNTKGDGFVLKIGWLLGTYRPRGPYTINMLTGVGGF
jgi:hypothetical protein